MKSLSEFKRGDSFMLACTHKVNGVPTSVTAFNIQAQIRTASNELISTLDAIAENQTASPGAFHLSPQNEDTSTWPIGPLYCDIQITSGGVTRSTSTFVVPVVKDITQ